MKTIFNLSDAINESAFVLSSDKTSDVIEKELNELFLIQAKLKKLEYYKSMLSESLKEYMQKRGLQELENINGKVQFVSMTQHRLDKELLLANGVSQSMIDHSMTENEIQQFRIKVR